MNSSDQKHQWYDKCGNEIVYHHAQCGALNNIKDWSNKNAKEKKDQGRLMDSNESSDFTLLFATGRHLI